MTAVDWVPPTAVFRLKEEGVEDGICWRLLTTLPVPDLERALRLSRWYAKRWQIEEFHRVLKTGCKVEARQMRTLARLKPMMALDMIVACTLMGMSAAARDRPESPASDWLDPEEIAAIDTYQRKGQRAAPNAAALSIGIAVKFIAKLGGHLGRKGDGHPGAQVLWQGIQKLDTITEAWRMFGPQNICG
jgi:Transposase Tn5 dimerisation domain